MEQKEGKKFQAREKDVPVHKNGAQLLPRDGLCIVKLEHTEVRKIERLLRSKELLRELGEAGINRWVYPPHRKVEVVYHAKPVSYEG